MTKKERTISWTVIAVLFALLVAFVVSIGSQTTGIRFAAAPPPAAVPAEQKPQTPKKKSAGC